MQEVYGFPKRRTRRYPVQYLISAKGKIFRILAKQLTEYLQRNSDIDSAVQKGRVNVGIDSVQKSGVSGMPGCLEHMGVVYP